LEEITEADLLIHVVDISHPNAINQAEAVQDTLEEIGASHIPVVVALNKLDLLADQESARKVLEYFPSAVAISALTGKGMDDLLELVRHSLYETLVPLHIHLPYQQGQLISLFHEFGQVERIEHHRSGVSIQGRIPGRLAARFDAWKAKPGKDQCKEEQRIQE
jgi:GTP-binding protein HflX